MDIKKEREEFEAWASKETFWDLYWSENINQYMDHQTNAAWLAWLAAKQQAVPDGFVVVKDKPVAYMIQNKSWAHSHGSDYFELKLLSEMPEPEFDDDHYDIEIPLYMIQEAQK